MGGIAEQFAGLQMDKLIGAPLTAAADASVQLANSTAEFINRVGFDNDGKVRNVAFGYQRRSVNEDGTTNLDEMKVDVPMLAIVPIPNLQVDEVNVLFDMEVKQSEKKEEAFDLGASIKGEVNLGIVKVSVTGSVSAHNSNTRSSDNSAKYHVDVRATNHGTPEGLARVLDMMAANVAPSLVGSTLKDADGKDLTGQQKQRAERLKTMRAQIILLQRREDAAKKSLEESINVLKDYAMSQLNVYHGIAENAKEEYKETINQGIVQVDQSWNDFLGRTASLVERVFEMDTEKGVSKIFALKGMDEKGEVADYSSSNGGKFDMIAAAQEKAVKAQENYNKIKQQYINADSKYQNILAGIDEEGTGQNSSEMTEITN